MFLLSAMLPDEAFDNWRRIQEHLQNSANKVPHDEIQVLFEVAETSLVKFQGEKSWNWQFTGWNITRVTGFQYIVNDAEAVRSHTPSSNASTRAMMARWCLYRLVIWFIYDHTVACYVSHLWYCSSHAQKHSIYCSAFDAAYWYVSTSFVWGFGFAFYGIVPKHLYMRFLIFIWQIALQGLGGANKQYSPRTLFFVAFI